MSSFDEIVAGLELDEPEDAVDYSGLDSLELNRQYNLLRQQLLEIGEMRYPKTDEGRELHSRRTAMVVELRKRGLIG